MEIEHFVLFQLKFSKSRDSNVTLLSDEEEEEKWTSEHKDNKIKWTNRDDKSWNRKFEII